MCQDLTESTVLANTSDEVHRDKKDEENKMEDVVEGEDKEGGANQGVTGPESTQSLFSSGNLSRELAIPNVST